MVDEPRQELQDEESAADQAQGTVAVEEDLVARIASLEEQLATAQDQALRAAADVQNARRRAEQEVEKAHKFALERFANDLLAVVDSLERGLELSNGEDPAIKPMRDGMELTLKLFGDTLARYQVVAVDPHGEPFNPELHQAMTMEERDNVEPNTVIKVFQKGYTISGRLLRPAMVVVSKAGVGSAAGSIDEKA
ncbi:molecular chaperone GrpE [Halopseudomonas litoralis]|uniref:Protein GrpE n=1 Tax=Halopseudomonas litoralis TaxID=797277 RepID=A0A1H1L1E2_9GAMM|nr:nucleotide exchange factor GrpE [Halopseudomonas litoralis]SDR68418.1 molecular chaperone GrpE [Halopseudomonas litoralis]